MSERENEMESGRAKKHETYSHLACYILILDDNSKWYDIYFSLFFNFTQNNIENSRQLRFYCIERKANTNKRTKEKRRIKIRDRLK